MAHPIVHIEIPAQDPAKAAQFYGQLFDWQTEEHPGMDYVTFSDGGQMRGGFPRMDGDSNKLGGTLLYVFTDDIEDSLAKAESLGATTVTTKSEIPGVGWFGIFTDPSGINIAVFTNA